MRKKIAIIMSLALIAATTTLPTTTFAADEVEVEETADSSQSLAMNTYLLKKTMQKQGIDVLSELEHTTAKYESLLKKASSEEEKQQIQELIDTTKELMNAYYRANYCASTQGISNVTYAVPIAAVIGYFSAEGYKLAAELLTHMNKNKSLDSTYTPTYGYLVKSSEVFQAIANGSKTAGSAGFENNGTTVDKDLYYAIHLFNYTKPSPDSKTVQISDRYDYASGNYSGVAGVAINTMKAAQDAGVLIPFYTEISETL